MPLSALHRVRWAIRGTLALGVAASVAANILHARHNPISQAIAAWPPLALLVTIELISRVPMHRRALAATRVLATAGIAGIAAWVSYWHMAGVAARYGESQTSAYLLPLSVDGLIVVASVSLVELAGRIRQVRERDQEQGHSRPVTPPHAHASVPAARHAQPVPASQPPLASQPAASVRTGHPAPAGVAASGEPAPPASGEPAPAATAPRRPAPLVRPGDRNPRQAPRQRRPVAETATLAAAIEATHPDISQAELARQLGISPSRLRAIKRETRELDRAA